MDLNIVYGIIIVIIIIVMAAVSYREDNLSKSTEYMELIDDDSFPFKTFIISIDSTPERYEYVAGQLRMLNIDNYEKWPGVDGSKISAGAMIKEGVNRHLAQNAKGGAGCALSHIRLWRHILSEKLGWTLILEDDAYFHPQFLQLFPHYWNRVPKDAKIVYLGYCGDYIGRDIVDTGGVICAHAYMISWEGAQYLLNNVTPMRNTLDGSLCDHFKHRAGSYIFNGDAVVNGIRPHDHENIRGSQHGGIIYQNQGEFPSMIVSINNYK